MNSGSTSLVRQLEAETADFLGVEDTISYPMGFGTNTMSIPAIVGKVRAEIIVL